ncbi:zf-HC2 domain-containing protein [Halosquirtibacter laminarini]|uniref:Zf-HC2 domain-containing protein n=1 Tax=Halosquirtibacter laminarini TaxID=3374600 RepID=A0AC61NMN6_9BACT|nr:zf-HC2 domain-containing protein [Prolixibacteraceae bacterium]
MTCINEDLIQRYIDTEVTSEEKAYIENHLQSCEYCNKQVEQQRQLAAHLKGMISQFQSSNIEIPPFEEIKKTGHLFRYHKRKVVGALLVAASIVISCFLFQPKEEKQKNYLITYDLEQSLDANLPLEEQNLHFQIIEYK